MKKLMLVVSLAALLAASAFAQSEQGPGPNHRRGLGCVFFGHLCFMQRFRRELLPRPQVHERIRLHPPSWKMC